jgi:hypothetical protein
VCVCGGGVMMVLQLTVTVSRSAWRRRVALVHGCQVATVAEPVLDVVGAWLGLGQLAPSTWT